MGNPVVTSGFVGAIGLVLDITGAMFLAQSFVLKKKVEIVRDTASYFDINPYLLRSACYQSVEARFGLFFLVLGFIGQFLAYTGVFHGGPTHYVAQTLLIGVLVLVVANVLSRAVSFRLSRHLLSAQLHGAAIQVLEFLSKQGDSYADKAAASLNSYGKLIKQRRKDGESTEEYGERLIVLMKQYAGNLLP
jgi:hypothetical protein